ncbi:Cutinase transcription factor 1 alpha [Penicillium subrubescens]|uniref:Cutinase transcription factor 1 alpha n=1 Tax=Penicillium subrubescens TaxID=1316194 RepID=A0A1Q5UK06_9EURO|nr:Cutinase transcription factor 1 alpha [Penicillium subrubescens]
MGVSERRLRKRIWWTLFTRDRSLAAAFGHPVNINFEDADVEDLNESDLIEDEDESFQGHDPQFFVKYVELSKIMQKITSMQRSPVDTLDIQAARIAQCEIELHEWLVKMALRLLRIVSEVWPMATRIAEFADCVLNDQYFHQLFVERMTEYRRLEFAAGMSNMDSI